MGVLNISAKHLFVTFSNVATQRIEEFTHNELFEWLSGKCENVYSCEEFHEDGALHYHALLTHSGKFRIRRSDILDYKGCHPSIESCKSLKGSVAYIGKGGVTLGVPPRVNESGPSRHDQWYDVIKRSNTVEEFLKEILELDAYTYATKYDAMVAFAGNHFERVGREYTPLYARDTYNVSPAMNAWVDRYITNPIVSSNPFIDIFYLLIVFLAW